MINVFNIEPLEYSKYAISILEDIGNYYDTPTKEPIHAIITRLGELIDYNFLNRFPELKFILTATTGLNHIDEAECAKRQIQIISLRGEVDFLSSIAATAEHTIALMLSLLRHIPASVTDVNNGNWDRMTHKGNELKNKTLCILGMGRLGVQVAHIASAFQMKIQCFDHIMANEYSCSNDLKTALHGSDIISIHLPYDENTHGLITKEHILQMNPSGYVINTSRGQIINETDLVECLYEGFLAGVAVDVLETEYLLTESPLWKYSQQTNVHNVIITPHIGGCTYESMENTEIFIAQKFKQLLGHNQ